MSGQLEQVLAFIMQSVALQNSGQTEAALACLDQALGLAPDFPTALIKRGSLLLALGRPSAALQDFDHCLNCAPAMSHVLALRDTALQAALNAMAQDRESVVTLCARALLLQRVSRDDDALEEFRAALALDAQCHAAWNGMGNLLLRLNRHVEAQACYQAILDFSPDDAIALFNSGNVSQQEGEYGAALACYAHALTARPAYAEIMMEQAHCHLAQGDWQKGWPLFEARWNTAQLKSSLLPSIAPPWRGESLSSVTVLLWAEQGLGDTLQFVRYVPLVAERVGRVVLRVPVSLHSLLGCLASARVTLMTQDQPLPPHDYQCPLMSLPLAFASTPRSVPCRMSYLGVPQAHTEKWRTLLGARHMPARPRIGFAWAGGQRHLNNSTRDMPLTALLPLLEIEAEWFSLQKQVTEADSATLHQYPQIARWEQHLADFSDTAALVSELDLIISVDTSVAHLAGALGKPVWLLLRKAGEWRWQLDGMRSVWYPQHRLYRQSSHGDWSAAVQQVKADLG